MIEVLARNVSSKPYDVFFGFTWMARSIIDVLTGREELSHLQPQLR